MISNMGNPPTKLFVRKARLGVTVQQQFMRDTRSSFDRSTQRTPFGSSHDLLLTSPRPRHALIEASKAPMNCTGQFICRPCDNLERQAGGDYSLRRAFVYPGIFRYIINHLLKGLLTQYLNGGDCTSSASPLLIHRLGDSSLGTQ